MTGGVALLNPRLIAATPAGVEMKITARRCAVEVRTPGEWQAGLQFVYDAALAWDHRILRIDRTEGFGQAQGHDLMQSGLARKRPAS